jgi:hypothetical protein
VPGHLLSLFLSLGSRAAECAWECVGLRERSRGEESGLPAGASRNGCLMMVLKLPEHARGVFAFETGARGLGSAVPVRCEPVHADTRRAS